MKNSTTTNPVEPGNSAGHLPEFGRFADLNRLFGLKRGTTYNLLKARKIKSCLLRVKGHKSGIRLFDLASVRAFILSQMSEEGAV